MPETNLPLEITPRAVKRRMDEGERLLLLDVREPYEQQRAAIDGAELIPMHRVPANLPHIENLAGGAAVVVFCHHGIRSLQAANWLRKQGVGNCQSMAGGIDRWSAEVDPTVVRY